jgi:hypothetical protein
MKHFLPFLSVFILLLLSEPVLAQTSSDYYLPLATGNNIHLFTQWPAPNQGWSQRTTTFTIDEMEMISGQQYFKEVGREIDSVTSVFRVMWLRRDDAGNVVLGAVSTSESTSLDSAMIIDPAFPIFPNEFLTPGKYLDYSAFGMPFNRDSVVSVTETVNTPYGTFTNCINICSMHRDSSGTIIFREYTYYAKGIGEVMDLRDIPVDQAHMDALVSYNITTSVQDKNPALSVNEYALEQNYPNPFNPATTINYSIPKAGNVSIAVYNLIGSKVADIVDGYKPAGNYSAHFDAGNLASGIYFYRLQSGNYNTAKKFILMK